MDKNVDVQILLDVYGNLLPNAQRDNLDFYYNQDLSLGEIADNTGRTRQAIFDSIKRGENALYDFEAKLGFVKKFEILKSGIEKTINLSENFKNSKHFKEHDIQNFVDSILETLYSIKI